MIWRLALALALAPSLALAARDVVIPPVSAPGGSAGRMEAIIALVDAAGNPIPSADTGNTTLVNGSATIAVTSTPVTITLATQDELAGTTYYAVTVRQGSRQWTRRVQVPAGDGSDLTWAQFLELGAPVDAADLWSGRLLPGGGADAACLAKASAADYDVEWVACGAGGAGTGTVTSVAVSGSDGIQVDSGSPVTTSGTIALGISASGLATHLGLGTAAYTAATAYATAAQGTQGAAAYAWGNHAAAGYASAAGLATVATTGAYSDLSGRPTLGTAAATAATDYATAAQGATADTAIQPGDDAAYLGAGVAADGYVLTADGAGGAAWEAATGGGGGGALGDLSDVGTATPTAGHALMGDGDSWESRAIAAGDIASGTLADARSSAISLRAGYAWVLTPPGYAIATGSHPITVDTAATPARLHIGCTTAPAGSAIIVDLKQATSPTGTQTSILSSTLSLAAGSAEATTTSFASGASLALEDTLVLVVTQADSSAASRGCVATLEVTRAP